MVLSSLVQPDVIVTEDWLTLGPTSPGGPGSPGKPTGPYRVQRQRPNSINHESHLVESSWKKSLKSYVCFVGVLQGFLWVRRLRFVLVLQLVQLFQVVPPLPSHRALLEDPASDSGSLSHIRNCAEEEFNSGRLATHLLAGLSADSRRSRLTRFSLWRRSEGQWLSSLEPSYYSNQYFYQRTFSPIGPGLPKPPGGPWGPCRNTHKSNQITK